MKYLNPKDKKLIETYKAKSLLVFKNKSSSKTVNSSDTSFASCDTNYIMAEEKIFTKADMDLYLKTFADLYLNNRESNASSSKSKDAPDTEEFDLEKELITIGKKSKNQLFQHHPWPNTFSNTQEV